MLRAMQRTPNKSRDPGTSRSIRDEGIEAHLCEEDGQGRRQSDELDDEPH